MAGAANGADLLGISADTGTLLVGKSADIIAVPGKALQDITALEHPLFVMKQGTICRQ